MTEHNFTARSAFEYVFALANATSDRPGQESRQKATAESLGREAKRIYKEWYDNLADQKNNGSLAFAGMATKMEPYCGRLALGLEIIKYGYKEGDLQEISADSMHGAIDLCYYFMACGLKAQKQFLPSPTVTFTTVQ